MRWKVKRKKVKLQFALLESWTLVTVLAVPTAIVSRFLRVAAYGEALCAIMPISLIIVVAACWLAAKNAERRRVDLDVEATAAAMRAHGPLRKSRVARVPRLGSLFTGP